MTPEVTDLAGLRVAIVHYWLVSRGGGEKVVEALAEMFPQADLFSLIAIQEALSPALQKHTLRTSFIQKIPGGRKFHRYFLPLQPLALEQFDLSGYDLVISSESGPAKGVITSSKTCHICYCHSPMRYIWDMYPDYKLAFSPMVRPAFSLVAHYLRLWDRASADRVDYFVANSKFVASRIRKFYRRDSAVIYPPVAVSTGNVLRVAEDYYIAIGRLVDYKRFDLSIEACTKLNKRLLVIGDGPSRKALQRAAGPTVTFLGEVSDGELRNHLASSRALLFPGEEDFGIVPVEAQSFGKPVIAYASGGALETVRAAFSEEGEIENPTGVFFQNHSVSGLTDAILRFEAMEKEGKFRPHTIRQHAKQFDKSIFQLRMAHFLRSALKDFRAGGEHRAAGISAAS
jgi:glycosyltransferase involved in cell wall biosynthesis